MSGLPPGSLDLLHQRRLERGLPPEAPALVPATRLLLIGAAAGLGAVGAALLVWALLGVRQSQVSVELEGLRAIPAAVRGLEAKAQASRLRLRKLQASNGALAKGLVAVSSGSALVTELAAITPEGVQLTEAVVNGSALQLKGVASDPEAFRRVNALQLLLKQSPMFVAKSVRVLKLAREQEAGGTAAKGAVPPVGWELAAEFAQLSPAAQRSLLQRLGADGMARRLQVLARAGVLP
jgi:type IV pilus assembly protein PilN